MGATNPGSTLLSKELEILSYYQRIKLEHRKRQQIREKGRLCLFVIIIMFTLNGGLESLGLAEKSKEMIKSTPR